MTHLSEDELLAFALEADESPSRRADVAAHLDACAACRVLIATIERDLGILGGIEPAARPVPVRTPRPRRLVLRAFPEAAALLAAGFVLGFGLAGWTRQEATCISPAYFTPSPPADSLMLYAVSDATDAAVGADAVLARDATARTALK